MTKIDAFAADLPDLERELHDRQKAQDLTAVVEHLMSGGADGRAGAGALLRAIEEREPGELERMRDRLQLARLRRLDTRTAH